MSADSTCEDSSSESSSEEILKTVKNQKVSNVLCEMYKNAGTADVYFKFKLSDHEQERIPAHKCVLAQGSNVFQRMFFGDLRKTGDVLINDVQAEAFDEFLQFFYLNEVTLTNENIAEVIYLTNKYNLVECSLMCANFLEQILNAETMCWGYELAILYDLKKLCSFCENQIAFDTTAILKSESFKDCSRSVLKRILLMDNLNCMEIEVFDACMKWVESSYNKQNETTMLSDLNATSSERQKRDKLAFAEQAKLQLLECFDLIRFPTMTVEQFSACMKRCDGIMNSDEIADIKEHITQRCSLKGARRFNDTVRLWKVPKWSVSKKLCCKRYKYVSYPDRNDEEMYMKLNKEGSMTFSTNKRILLGGLGIESIQPYKSRFNCSLQTKFEIWTKVVDENLSERNKLVFQHSEKVISGDRNCIEFFEPIVINPSQIYEIRIIFNDDKSTLLYMHANIEEDQTTVTLDNDIEIQVNQDEDEYYSNTTGRLIAELYFNPL